MQLKPIFSLLKTVEFEAIELDEGKDTASSLVLRLELFKHLKKNGAYQCKLFRYEQASISGRLGDRAFVADEIILVQDIAVFGEVFELSAVDDAEAEKLATERIVAYFNR